jgi:hypothetical protein
MRNRCTTKPTQNVKHLAERMTNIIRDFYYDEFSYRREGTEFGCDWPTMRIVCPNHAKNFDRLRQQAKEQINAPEL